MSPSPSKSAPAQGPPRESSPHPNPGQSSKQGGASKGKRPQRNGHRRSNKPDVAWSSSGHGSPSGMRFSSPGKGPSRRLSATQRKDRQDGTKGTAWNDATFGSIDYVPRDHYSHRMPYHYESRPQMGSYASHSIYFGPHNNGMPPPIPPSMAPFMQPSSMQPPSIQSAYTAFMPPMPLPMPPPMPPYNSVRPYAEPAASSHQTSSPEAEQLEKIKKDIEEEEMKLKANEERKRRDDLEQELTKKANEAISKSMMDTKSLEEATRREIEEAKREAYNAARAEFQAEESRRRLTEQQYEECRRIASEKVEAEMRLKDEEKRRAEEERGRMAREVEARIASHMEELRRRQHEEEERTAHIRQQVEDQVRAQMLSIVLPSRTSSSVYSRSSQHGDRSSPSTRRSSKVVKPSLLEQIGFSSTGGRPQSTASAEKTQIANAQDSDEEAHKMVLNPDAAQGVPGNLLIYYQGQSTATPSLAGKRSGVEDPCCMCGKYPKNSFSQVIGSQVTEEGLFDGGLDARLARRVRRRTLLPASRSRGGQAGGYNSDFLDDEWLDTSTTSTASTLGESDNLDGGDGRSQKAEDSENYFYPKTTSHSNFTFTNTETSTSKSRLKKVEADNEPSLHSKFKAPGEHPGQIDSRNSINPSFSVFQYLVEDTSNSNSDPDPDSSEEDYNHDFVEEGGEDDDSADGGAVLTDLNGQASSSLNILTKHEADSLLPTQHHPTAETTQVQDGCAQDYHLLRLLEKHITHYEQTSQGNTPIHIGSPSQDWRRGEKTESQPASYLWACGYVPNWSDESQRYIRSPNSMIGGQRMWPAPSVGLQINQLTQGPAVESDSNLLKSDYIPIVPMALIPCIILPRGVMEPAARVPGTDDTEGAVRLGQNSE